MATVLNQVSRRFMICQSVIYMLIIYMLYFHARRSGNGSIADSTVNITAPNTNPIFYDNAFWIDNSDPLSLSSNNLIMTGHGGEVKEL